MFKSVVKSFDSGNEGSEDQITFLAVSFSSDEESLILEVASHFNCFVFPILNVVFTNPRINLSIKAIEVEGLFIGNTFLNLLPSGAQIEVLAVVVESTITS